MQQKPVLCLECGEQPATQGHVCHTCYVRTLEEAHRHFYGEEAVSNG